MSEWGAEMDIEFSQLELRYERLRRRNANKERQLVASLAEKGQQLPVVVVGGGDPCTYVLLDGYKRVRALKRLRHDTVRAILWDLNEVDAVLLERLMRTTESDGALEQGWLLEELSERFALSGEELACRFDKSQSWVSRRLALVRAVPREVQEHVQRGDLPAHAAMKYLVPMARAKRADCVRLIEAIGSMRPSTRDVEALYATWVSGNKATRELVVTQPSLVLKAREQARSDKTSEQTPGRQLLNDFGILVGASRRARTKLVQGLLAHLLPTEAQEAKRIARQARCECDALFRSAVDLFAATTESPDACGGSLIRAEPQRPSQESASDR
ncbi:MAG: ParB/RepB/Spo0J family partition protein [Thermoanaerobaculales bacterium]